MCYDANFEENVYPKVLTGVISGTYAYGFTERYFS